MKTLVTSAALACAIVAAPAAMAEGEKSAWESSANVALTTDYVFRGISQTDEEPAIQGGFDVGHSSGFYIGTWASNIDFGSDASAEIDVYTGYAFDVAEGVNLDLGVTKYMYPSEGDLNYVEWAAKLGFSGATVGVVYSDEYLGDGGEKFFYLFADYSVELSGPVSLDLHVGYNDADDQDITGDNDDSYVDYLVGVSTEVIGLGVSLAVTGTDIDSDVDAADERVVFTISKDI